MSVPSVFGGLVGNWTGFNRLFTPWMPVKIHQSESAASISLITRESVLCIKYTWAYAGKEQDGIMLISREGDRSNEVKMTWTDSWHSPGIFMICSGSHNLEDSISVGGHYAYPGHPDWGWETEIIAEDDSFKFTMHNVPPDGPPELAVESEFRRN